MVRNTSHEFCRLSRAAIVFLVWSRMAAAGLIPVRGPAPEAETRVLEDLLGIRWKREPVSFTIDAPEGRCHIDSVRLEGPGGPVASQLADVKPWPGTPYVRTGELWIVTDLDALERREYSLRCGPEPDLTPPPSDDLRVVRAETSVDFTSARFGVRLLMGKQAYDPPVAASEVPGPVERLRRGDGTWFGGSELYGESRVRGYSAEVVAEGPVFGTVRIRYAYEDGNVLEVSVTLHARSEFVVLQTDSRDDRTDDGFRLLLSPGLPPLERVDGRGDPLGKAPEGTIIELSPWSDWFWDHTTPRIRLAIDEGRELIVNRLHPGRWVEPLEPPGTLGRWPLLTRKRLHLRSDGEGRVYLRFNNAQGERHIELGEQASEDVEQYRQIAYQRERLRLHAVRDMVLDWPASDERHPRLYMTSEELEQYRTKYGADPRIVLTGERIAREKIRPAPSYKDEQALAVWLATGDDAWVERVQLTERLRRHLDLLGDFDRMRHTDVVASLYDALIDSGHFDASERRMLRARMALIAYQLADPATWSDERGYRSYNPNMSTSFAASLGIVAALLRDHPKADAWIENVNRRMLHWFDVYITPHGEWFEAIHYAHGSASDLFSYAVAAHHAGFDDLIRQEPLRRLAIFLAQQYTPPDPRHGGRRSTSPVGRGTSGMAYGHSGVLAKSMQEIDPEFSRIMQWLWRQAHQPVQQMELGGFRYFYPDPDLPEQQPDWGTTRFPNYSIIFRSGLGHRLEHYLNLLAVTDTRASVRPQEVGSIVSWFAFGQPVSVAFNQPEDYRMHRLMNQVTPAERINQDSPHRGDSRGPERSVDEQVAFSRLALADYSATRYVLGEPWHRGWELPELPVWPEAGQTTDPVQWERQLLFLKADEPDGLHYIVLNDSIVNHQPTRWHFWSLSEALGSAAEAARDDFADEAPGPRPAAARELEGDRFTARGRYGVDLEYFVAAPSGTPRHTLRYGGVHRAYDVNLEDYQDLLHLQMPGSGRYYVVIVPRRTGDPVPEFERIGNGAILRVSAGESTDYLMLSRERAEAECAENAVEFAATAAAVRERDDGFALILADAGRVRFNDTVLVADGPAELRYDDSHWRLNLDHGDPVELWTVPNWSQIARASVNPMDRIRIEILHPGADGWDIPPLPDDVRVERAADRLQLSVPRGVGQIDFPGVE